jgi:hypothetical protein
LDDSGNDKRAARARSPQEILDSPEENILDTVYYVEKCIATVVKQLRPDKAAEDSIKDLLVFAKGAAAMAAAARGPSPRQRARWEAMLGAGGGGAGAPSRKPVDMAAIVAAQPALRVRPNSAAPGTAAGPKPKNALEQLFVVEGTQADGSEGHGAGGPRVFAAPVKKETAADKRRKKAAAAAHTAAAAARMMAFMKGNSSGGSSGPV